MKSLNVLETNILHASDVIYWLDGTSAESEADMLRIVDTVQLTLTTRPSDLQWLHTTGKTALWRRPSTPMVAGRASEPDLMFPTEPQYAVEGIVSDAQGHYNPRTFSINAGDASGRSIVLYPTPLSSRFGRGGGGIGTLRFSASGSPVPWALLTLEVTTALASTQTFRAQSSAEGDFMISTNRLPPLMEGVNNYLATLKIEALASAQADVPLDPSDLVAMPLGDLESVDTFLDPIPLTIIPGEIKLIRSMGKDHIAVQPI